jgi:trans-aconitate 2-methyltransferase
LTRAPTHRGPRDWNAAVYDRVSQPQLEWGLEVLERLPLEGGETVLDAGCGSGRVTAALARRLPRGCVVAVDASPSMVAKAREVLPQNATVFQAELSQLRLPEAVDAVFSNAVFHWIADHDRLFRRLHAALVPGGRLVAQCGGEGNVASLGSALGQVAADEPFDEFLGGWRGPWNFSSPARASHLLEDAGFVEVDCWLERKRVVPDDARDYLATVTLGVHLARLPERLRDPFVDRVLDAMPDPPTLDYVRLNISARRGG